MTKAMTADHVLVEFRLAVPLSLLVNEAVTNAYKHAYPNGQSGEILVRIANTADGGVRICVQDDGVGFTPDVREGALGLTMMRSFSGLRYFKWVAGCRFCHDRQLS
jgi:two-component sensor histidine kinase